MNVLGFKLAKAIEGSKLIPLIGAISCFLALIALLVQHYSVSKSDVFIALGIIVFCFATEFIYKSSEKKQ